MISESIDILWLALAVSAIVLTFFISWSLYYVVQLLKQTNESLTALQGQIEHLNQVLNTAESVLQSFRERFAATGAALGTIASAVKFFFEKRGAKKEKAEGEDA